MSKRARKLKAREPRKGQEFYSACQVAHKFGVGLKWLRRAVRFGDGPPFETGTTEKTVFHRRYPAKACEEFFAARAEAAALGA